MIRFVILCSVSLFLFGYVACDADADCRKLSNTACETCLNQSGCAFCKNSKLCFAGALVPTTHNCDSDQLQQYTCVADLKTWLIVIGTVGGVVLIAIIIVIICICRKCKRRSQLKEHRQQGISDQQMEDRRTAAETRRVERNQVADQLRMKYGLLKGKENADQYQRMS